MRRCGVFLLILTACPSEKPPQPAPEAPRAAVSDAPVELQLNGMAKTRWTYAPPGSPHLK